MHSKCSMTKDQQRGVGHREIHSSLTACWVMAGRVEINSGREDTVKTVHGTDILLLSGSPPEQRQTREALLLSPSELWITKAHSAASDGNCAKSNGGCVSGQKAEASWCLAAAFRQDNLLFKLWIFWFLPFCASGLIVHCLSFLSSSQA